MTKKVITVLGNRKGGEVTKVHIGLLFPTSSPDYTHEYISATKILGTPMIVGLAKDDARGFGVEAWVQYREELLPQHGGLRICNVISSSSSSSTLMFRVALSRKRCRATTTIIIILVIVIITIIIVIVVVVVFVII